MSCEFVFTADGSVFPS